MVKAPARRKTVIAGPILRGFNRAVISRQVFGWTNFYFVYELATAVRLTNLVLAIRRRQRLIKGPACFDICCAIPDVDFAQHSSYRRPAVRQKFRPVDMLVCPGLNSGFVLYVEEEKRVYDSTTR